MLRRSSVGALNVGLKGKTDLFSKRLFHKTLHSEYQVDLLKEPCILVDELDNELGPISKRDAHQIDPRTSKTPLHRAFSLFLFSEDGSRLLLQQRSDEKITFPGVWTNTCCSHPLYHLNREENDHSSTFIEHERDGLAGVKRAAIRKLKHELGYSNLAVEEIKGIARVLYSASSDLQWGENELDYILFARKPPMQDPEARDVKKDDQFRQFAPNEHEVKAMRWLPISELKELRESKSIAMSPWFKLIISAPSPAASEKSNCSLLEYWWRRFNSEKEGGDVEPVNELGTDILRLN